MDGVVLNFKIIFACILIFLSFGMVGARFAKLAGISENNAALNPFYGWAICILLMLALAPWMAGGGMIAFLIMLFIAGILMFSKERIITKALPLGFLVGLIVLLPLLYGLCNYPVREWDDMSHWLPNAHFLFQYGRFPAQGGPVAYSAWPAYPYGYSLLVASAGWIVGQFVEVVGPLLNLFLLVLFAAFLGQQINPDEKDKWQKVRLFVVMLLSVTLLNPALDITLLFSAYAEYTTAVLVALLLYVGWQYCQNPGRGLIISFALLSIIFVEIKQANIFMLALLVGSLWITTPSRKVHVLKWLLLGILPALAVNGFWEFYKAQHLAGLAFTFKPFHDWQWWFLPNLLNAMGLVALDKIGFFAILFGLIGWAVTLAFKPRTPLSQLVMSFALVALGHWAFLTLAYIGSRFSEWEITTAASFFRYMSQLQCAAVMILILRIAQAVRPRYEEYHLLLRGIGSLLVLGVPLAALVFVGFNLFEKPLPSIQATRNYAHSIFPKMPPQGKVGLIGTTTNGLENTMIRFEWCLMASPQQQPELTGYVTHYSGENTAEAVKRFAERYDAVMVAPNDELAMRALAQPKNDDWVSFVRSGQGKDIRWNKLLP